MYYYLIFGLKVVSDIAIEGAYDISEFENADVTVKQETFDKEYMEISDLERTNDKIGVVRHYEENWACVRFKEHGVFMIENGNTIKYQLYPWYDKHFLSQIFLCICMTVLLVQRNMILLHGSAILYKGKTLVISGDSGVGKSSLANEIMGRGYRQMSDDIVAIGQDKETMVIYPSFPVRKLCADFVEQHGMDKGSLIPMNDAEREKYGLILKEEYYGQQAQLGSMVIIRTGDVDEPVLNEITGSDKIKCIIQNLFRTDMYEQISFKPQDMLKAVKIASEMSIYVLIRPENKMTVIEQADLIERTI